MKFIFEKMENKFAEEILKWKYEEEYSFYDMEFDKEDLDEFLENIEKNNWKNTFSTLDENGNLIGFFVYTFNGDCMEIGFGLKPDLTGKGLGEDFVLAGIDFGISESKDSINTIKLAVASFNIRAIKLYKRLGFEETSRYIQPINDEEYEFINMKKAHQL